MDGWSGYSIAAVILVIIAIIMIIAGIVMLESQPPTMPATANGSWWPWGLIIGGVILLIIGIAVGFVGRRSATVTSSSTNIVHHTPWYPGYPSAAPATYATSYSHMAGTSLPPTYAAPPYAGY